MTGLSGFADTNDPAREAREKAVNPIGKPKRDEHLVKEQRTGDMMVAIRGQN